jgi:hypothetical protein
VRREWKPCAGKTERGKLLGARGSIDDSRLRPVTCSVRTKTSETSRLRVADDITQLVGETPMLQLKRLVPAGSADVFAKLEYLNPGGSVIGIIRRAEQ